MSVAGGASSALIKVFGLVFLVFGSYVSLKSGLHGSDKELSALAIYATSAGTFMLLTAAIDEIQKCLKLKHLMTISICCKLFMIISCALVVFLSLVSRKSFEIFLSHELDLLWTLRDSSKIYKSFVYLLMISFDCCKIHTLTDYNVNLPRSCCDEGDFECLKPEVKCVNLQSAIFILFSFLATILSINTLECFHRLRNQISKTKGKSCKSASNETTSFRICSTNVTK